MTACAAGRWNVRRFDRDELSVDLVDWRYAFGHAMAVVGDRGAVWQAGDHGLFRRLL